MAEDQRPPHPDSRPRYLRELDTRLPTHLRQAASNRASTTAPSPASSLAAQGDPVRRLLGLLRFLNHATEPGRNQALYWVSRRVGEMVVTGEVPDAHKAVDALTDVALSIGLEPREVRGTIRSGFTASGVTL